MKRAVILAFLLATSVSAAPPTTCGSNSDYGRALCAYQRRQFAEAAVMFEGIVGRDEADPQTIKALYFLARTEMKLGRFDEAATRFVRIYSLDASFYRSWNCDYLLGQCRRAMGKD